MKLAHYLAEQTKPELQIEAKNYIKMLKVNASVNFWRSQRSE
jgi:hypothetical protein